MSNYKWRIGRRLAVQVVLLVSYLTVWFLFGVLYKWIADSSKGDAFTFQEDLRLRSQAEAFVRATGVSVPVRRARDLIRVNEERLLLNLGDAPGPFSNESLGREWGLFYEDKLRAEGFRQFLLRELPAQPYPLATILARQDFVVLPTAFRKGVLKPPAAKPYALQLYQSPDDSLPTEKSHLEKYRLAREITVWSVNPPAQLVPEALLQPITLFAQDARHFLNFIDDSPNLLHSITGGEYRYPMLDFLYFSAITIGTVGYGDILPNRTDVRVLVMVEVLLGITLPGAFVSSLFMKEAA